MLPPLPQTFSAPSFSSPCCLRLRFVHQSLLHDYTIIIFTPIESTLLACAVATSSTATTRRSCTARLASSTGTRSLYFRHPGVGAGQQGLGAWLRARSDRVVLVSTAGSPVTRILQVFVAAFRKRKLPLPENLMEMRPEVSDGAGTLNLWRELLASSSLTRQQWSGRRRQTGVVAVHGDAG
ncbi:hypothetical protein PVAP13_3NG060080 [Panicum virgatum]|uniref:Uncharacterized protein n=1 Tax=Panicum virgatum TaxID=38727 RepID=A0A8T0U555_PANVG|nr:hypothetical protein PVAP13_3NG060080 [Panicum virgatum]